MAGNEATGQQESNPVALFLIYTIMNIFLKTSNSGHWTRIDKSHTGVFVLNKSIVKDSTFGTMLFSDSGMSFSFEQGRIYCAFNENYSCYWSL